MLTKNSRIFGLKICLDFAAAHHIKGYPGDCARPHGHNYKVEVEAISPVLNDIGLAIDFKVLKAMTKEIFVELDHRDLNELPPFRNANPTAENIARYVFEALEHRLATASDAKEVRLKQVTVWETECCAASYGYHVDL